MTFATAIELSESPNGARIATLHCRYHRFIHGEVMTHRVFSRNAMSSRAVPVKKVLAQVWSDPAIPVQWGMNVPGMQAHTELSGWRRTVARSLWIGAGRVACVFAWGMMKVGLAKQVANRLLEPWQWMHTIITATEWDNLFELRLHPDAQPEFRLLAQHMQRALQGKYRKLPGYGPHSYNWHLPYVTDDERRNFPLKDLVMFSAARCARVSYLTHEGKVPSPEQDRALFTRLVGSTPMHASPIEHQATGLKLGGWSANFKGFLQFRQMYNPKVSMSQMFNYEPSRQSR